MDGTSFTFPRAGFHTVLLMTCTLLFASPVFADARPHLPNEKQRLDWLAASVDASQIQWLEAEQRFFSLYAESQTGQVKGAVILIPPTRDQVGWPITLRRLLEYLPNYGWNTLAISLPTANTNESNKSNSPDTNSEQATGSNSENSETANSETTNTETTADQSSSVKHDSPLYATTKQRLFAAQRFLNEKGQSNLILIGLGSGAWQAAHFAQTSTSKGDENPEENAQGLASANPSNNTSNNTRTNNTRTNNTRTNNTRTNNTRTNNTGTTRASAAPVQALIMINALNQQRAGDKNLAEITKELPVRILDIFQPISPDLSRDAKKRVAIMQRFPANRYQQIRLPPTRTETDARSDPVVKRIRGWLDRHMSGTRMNAVYR